MTRVIQAPADGRIINARLGIDWSNWDYPAHLAYSQRDMVAFWPTAVIAAPDRPQPLTYAGTSLELERLHAADPDGYVHLSRIYDKTGVNSQPALVRLLLSVG